MKGEKRKFTQEKCSTIIELYIVGSLQLPVNKATYTWYQRRAKQLINAWLTQTQVQFIDGTILPIELADYACH